MVSIQQFFASHSQLQNPDRLTLIYQLYKVYTKIIDIEEPFHRFYFWGDTLLRDFDEIDKNLVNASQLFRDLHNLKEIDEFFAFMPEEQKELLKTFWQNIHDTSKKSTEEFIKVWRQLFPIYTAYVDSLKENKWGYEGMIQREVVDSLAEAAPPDTPLVFIGFNVLTKAEEKLLCHYVEKGSKVYWDMDAYYMDDPKQEAGLFLRRYRQHPILSKTFTTAPACIKGEDKSIHLISTPQRIGQARLAGQRIGDEPSMKSHPEKTVIVLPDEGMLLPMLYALPPALAAVNVTMGYPLQQTLLYTFLDIAIEMQSQRKQDCFHHRQVMALLTHTYVIAHEKDQANLMCTKITTSNRVYISANELLLKSTLGKLLFSVVAVGDAFTYLLDLIKMLNPFLSQTNNFNHQCAFHLCRDLSRLSTILHADTDFLDWNEFREMFHQIISLQKIPFSGEPVDGLQIMGLLETRNLDFENVHLLSLNEGILPIPARQNSYIPYRIRKAYRLPTHDYQGALYAYLFYRLLQRSKRVWMYYSTEVDPLGGGEMSRYVKQLLYESGLPITTQIQHDTPNALASNPITVQKTEEIYRLLTQKYRQEESTPRTPKALTPSALNDYIDCRLRFYLKHIARLQEPQKVEETPDARIFGNILHDTVHILYTDLAGNNEGKIESDDLEEIDEQIAQSVDNAFSRQYPPGFGEKLTYKGQYLVVQAMVKEWVKKIIEHDKAYAPFTIVSLEKQLNFLFSTVSPPILLGGKVDRIDRKENTLRIVDYKTGKDELTIADIAALFTREGKRNKAAFQTFFYAYLYYQQEDKWDIDIVPGLINRNNLFAPDFSFGHTILEGRKRTAIKDARPHFAAFEQHLKALLDDLYDSSMPFDQTGDAQNCIYCDYRYLCHR